MSAVSETAFRMALAAMLADPVFDLPAALRGDIHDHLTRTDAMGLTLCFENLERYAVLARLYAWADGQGGGVGMAIRKALGEEIDPATAAVSPSQARLDKTRQALTPTESERAMTVAEVVKEVTPQDELMESAIEREIWIVGREMEREPYFFPDEGPKNRLTKAIDRVLHGGVTPNGDGTYIVKGSKDNTYHCTDVCTCPQGQKGKSKWCYHLVAVALYEEVQRRLPQQALPIVLGPQTVDERLAQIPKETPMTASVVEELEIADMPVPVAVARASTLRLPRRSIQAIIADLSRPLPQGCLVMIERQGRSIPGLHWYTVRTLLDTYAPGWHSRITTLQVEKDVCRVVCRLGIPCAEGIVWREGTGEKDDWEADPKQYGNPAANAEANAFKRAASKFGVGAYLYEKDQTTTALDLYLKEEKTRVLEQLGQELDRRQMPRQGVITWLRSQTGADTNAKIPVAALKALLADLMSQNPTPEKEL